MEKVSDTKHQNFQPQQPTFFSVAPPKSGTDIATPILQKLPWLDIPLLDLPKAYHAFLQNPDLNPEQKEAGKNIARFTIQQRLQPVINTVNEKIYQYKILSLIESYFLNSSPYPTHHQIYTAPGNPQFLFDAFHMGQHTKYEDLKTKYETFKNHFMDFLTPAQKNFDPNDFTDAVKKMQNTTPDFKANVEGYISTLIDYRNAASFNSQQYSKVGDKICRLSASDDWNTVNILEYTSLKDDALMFFHKNSQPQ